MIQRAWVEVDLEVLRANAAALADLVAPASLIAPVVKANAYGHGLVECARALEDLPRVWGFCVARAEEALVLREAGLEKHLLVLGPPPVEDIYEVAQERITLGIGSDADVRALSEGLNGAGLGLDVHLKVNTGMCRMGVDVEQVAALAASLDSGPLQLRGVYSHFADAEGPDLEFTQCQLAAFREALAALGDRNVLRHTCNSAGLCRVREARFDLVRPGAVLYGLNPGIPEADFPPVRPALRIVSRVASIKQLAPGSCVGYGRRFRLGRPSAIALVPVGYADGYPRTLSGRAEALIRGRRAPVVGAVNMDSITVDVTDLELRVPGDEVVLLGEQDGDRITVEELAERAGTIVHEIPTRLGPRLPRVYV